MNANDPKQLFILYAALYTSITHFQRKRDEREANTKRQRQRGDDTTESILNHAMHIQTHTQHTTGRQ